MNYIKNKLQNHEIKPSKMAWERIEAELDKDKVRVLPTSVRWAAAAMVLVAVTGIIAYDTSQKVDNQGVVNSEIKKTEPISTPNTVTPISPKVETAETEKSYKLEQNTNTVIQKYKLETAKENNNFVQTPLQIPTYIKEEKKNTTARPQLESPNTIAKNEWKYLEIKTQNIDIQRINEDDEEDMADDNLTLPNLLNRAEGDSTLTEKIINFGQIKAKQVVAKAFRPVLKRFNKN